MLLLLCSPWLAQFSLSLSLTIFNCMYVWVCACECSYPQRPEEGVSPLELAFRCPTRVLRIRIGSY